MDSEPILRQMNVSMGLPPMRHDQDAGRVPPPCETILATALSIYKSPVLDTWPWLTAHCFRTRSSSPHSDGGIPLADQRSRTAGSALIALVRITGHNRSGRLPSARR